VTRVVFTLSLVVLLKHDSKPEVLQEVELRTERVSVGLHTPLC
jgi:hypothetical protein